MRLLNTKTFEVQEFPGPESGDCPPYAILSHTWNGEEVTLQEMQSPSSAVKSKPGYHKIQGFAEKAASNGFQYVWIDTCCIDKSSSAELSEAINSMYKWYQLSHVCYTYLSDVPTSLTALISRTQRDDRNGSAGRFDETADELSALETSRWFTRGWTLQELLAPPIVEFYAADWTEIGTKLSLSKHLAKITRVREPVLRGVDPASCLVAERMSWAARRNTSRLEDSAYCLLGIFQVNMPLLYGEGNRAFQRLQEEIMKNTEDYSLFAWGVFGHQTLLPVYDNSSLIDESPFQSYDTTCNFVSPEGLLAKGPRDFMPEEPGAGCGYADLTIDRTRVPAVETRLQDDTPIMTGRGLRISLPIMAFRRSGMNHLPPRGGESATYSCLAYINCQLQGRPICVALRRKKAHAPVYERLLSVDETVYYSPVGLENFTPRTIYIERKADTSLIPDNRRGNLHYDLDIRVPCSDNIRIRTCRLRESTGTQWPESEVVDAQLSFDSVTFIRCNLGDNDTAFVVIFGRRWCQVLPLRDPRFSGIEDILFEPDSWTIQIQQLVWGFLEDYRLIDDRCSIVIGGFHAMAAWKPSGIKWRHVLLVEAEPVEERSVHVDSIL